MGLPALDVDLGWAGAGRLVRQSQPSGRVLSMTHHAHGALASIRDGEGGPLIAQYDGIGSRRLRVQYGNGLVMDRRDPVTGSTILGAEAGFDANGRPVRMRWGAPGGMFTAR